MDDKDNVQNELSQYLTATAASRRANISLEWLRRLADKGRISCVKIDNRNRLYKKDDLDKLRTELDQNKKVKKS